MNVNLDLFQWNCFFQTELPKILPPSDRTHHQTIQHKNPEGRQKAIDIKTDRLVSPNDEHPVLAWSPPLRSARYCEVKQKRKTQISPIGVSIPPIILFTPLTCRVIPCRGLTGQANLPIPRRIYCHQRQRKRRPYVVDMMTRQ